MISSCLPRTGPADEFLPTLDSLVSPYGVVAAVGPAGAAFRGPAQLAQFRATAGRGAGRSKTKALAGGGRALGSPAQARLVAIAEAAERYAAGDFLGEPRVHATYAELDGLVLDPARFPRCSAAELRRPGCPVTPFDPKVPIRWVRGLELTSGEPVWVPAVMACYGLVGLSAAERFSYRISTGYAVHTDPVQALAGGICEVVERDAIALTWLQRLPLPLAPVSSAGIEELTGWAERHFIQTYLFDATTDLGIPTVYCLQVARYDDRVRHVVGCATAGDLTRAAEKALIETVSVRGALYTDEQPPADFAEFCSLTDGARYMGAPERSAAFSFLTDGARRRPAPTRQALPGDPGAALASLIAVFAERGMPVAVVDRTSRELSDAGLTCVSVVIPDLQPMSLMPLAQFRAHPRLYDAPARMGFFTAPEEELNPWPQPFA